MEPVEPARMIFNLLNLMIDVRRYVSQVVSASNMAILM